jgi:hypothetical protein
MKNYDKYIIIPVAQTMQFQLFKLCILRNINWFFKRTFTLSFVLQSIPGWDNEDEDDGNSGVKQNPNIFAFILINILAFFIIWH